MYKSSPQTVGSLDFFFGKQKVEFDSRVRKENASNNVVDSQASSQDEDAHKVHEQTSTDEELARKLQLEWAQQDRSLSANALDKPTETMSEGSQLSKDDRSLEINHDLHSNQDPPTSFDHAVDIFGFQPDGLEKKATLSLQSTASAEDAVSAAVQFDENPLTFDPGRYIPALKKYWALEDGHASYGLLTRCFVLINSTQSRIKIVDTLVNFLRTVIEGDPESLLPAVRHSDVSNLLETLLRLSRSGWRPMQFLLPISH